MKQIPFLSFAHMNEAIKQDALNTFTSFLDEGWYVLGKRVALFEEAYATFSGTTHCAGVANGLDALILALKALDIQAGDEVIVPSNTYIASWLAISYVGATPVPVEPRESTCNINPELIEQAITPKTKAIMPVHLYGQCCEMEKIMSIAQQHNLYVIEDNAQSQGATCNGKTTGSFGHINATSFYPGKNLGAYGDAGAVTTNLSELDQRVRVLRNYGSQQKYYNEVKGINSRLDELQAGLLHLKLKHLQHWNTERIQIADWYHEQLVNVGDLNLPQLAKGCTSVYHLYVVRTSRRNELQAHLQSKGIGTLIHYPIPPHLQQAYQEFKFQQGDFPIAERIAESCLSLPLYPGLSKEEVDYICATIQGFYHG